MSALARPWRISEPECPPVRPLTHSRASCPPKGARQRAPGEVSAGAADGEHALRLGVQVDHPAPFQRGGVKARRAQHAHFLVYGEYGFYPGRGQMRAVQQGQLHGHGGAVVAAQGGALRPDKFSVGPQIQTFPGHVLPAARSPLADHIHMALKDDRLRRLVARRGLPDDDHVAHPVLMDLQPPFPGEADQPAADGRRVAGAPGNGAQRFKIVKDGSGFQIV